MLTPIIILPYPDSAEHRRLLAVKDLIRSREER